LVLMWASINSISRSMYACTPSVVAFSSLRIIKRAPPLRIELETLKVEHPRANSNRTEPGACFRRLRVRSLSEWLTMKHSSRAPITPTFNTRLHTHRGSIPKRARG
jgi:hypothetical protein